VPRNITNAIDAELSEHLLLERGWIALFGRLESKQNAGLTRQRHEASRLMGNCKSKLNVKLFLSLKVPNIENRLKASVHAFDVYIACDIGFFKNWKVLKGSAPRLTKRGIARLFQCVIGG